LGSRGRYGDTLFYPGSRDFVDFAVTITKLAGVDKKAGSFAKLDIFSK
jgi:hypothetical protein